MKRTLRRFSANNEILNPGGRRSVSSLRICPWPAAGVLLQATAMTATNNALRRISLSPNDGGDSQQQFAIGVHADLGRCKRQIHTDRRLAASTAHGDVASRGRTVRAPELERQRGESEQTPLRFLALGDTQKHLRRSSVVLPTHVELWVSRLVQPLVKEPTKIRSGFLLYYALEVLTRCGRVAVGVIVASE